METKNQQQLKSLLRIEKSNPIYHPDGRIEWLLPNGLRHREFGPACINPNTGEIQWYYEGDFHSEHTPAIINEYGKRWYLKGKLHRIGGPAFQSECGNFQSWYQNGERHREDGPAYIDAKLNKSDFYLYDDKVPKFIYQTIPLPLIKTIIRVKQTLNSFCKWVAVQINADLLCKWIVDSLPFILVVFLVLVIIYTFPQLIIHGIQLNSF